MPNRTPLSLTIALILLCWPLTGAAESMDAESWIELAEELEGYFGSE